MDPVGPWSAYASYNRLAGVQPGGSTGDLHHHLTSSTATGSPATTTTQILPGGFLSPPPVGYEVFSPLFHPTSKPAAHYVNQHRQALAQAQAAAASASKQGADGEYHGQAQTFFEQGPTPWQQNSPFGILPHESVVTTTKAGPYENFNAHFTAQSLNQLVATNSKNVRPRSPQVTTATTKTSSTQQNSSTFFQGPSTYSAESTNNTKTFSTANTANLQQTCIVTSPTNTSVSKDYRVPQVPNRSVFPATSPSRTVEKSFSSAGNVKQSPQQAPPQIQTKAQTKIYPELANQTDRQRNSEENQSQSSPISYTMDNSRLNYTGNNVGNKRNQFQHSNYRHYQQQGSESDFQRPKAGSDYALSNGPDSAAIPRKQSPLQAHSQASPIGHAQSPAYPMYNSPMNSISSPQQSNNQVTPPSPLDVSVSRGNSQTSSVAYPSVITRALNNEKNYGERYERPGNQSGNNQNCWDERRKYQPQNAQSNYIPGSMEMTNRSTDPQQPNRATLVNVTDRQQAYFDNNHQVTMADLSSCRGDPMSIVKNLQQSCQVQLPEIKQEEKVNVKRRKSGDKGGATAMTEGGPPPMDYFPSPIPPPAHSSAANQQQQNGSYFDFDRWNLPNPNTKLFGSQGLHQQHQGLMVPHPHPHPPPPLPYFPPFHLPHHSAEYPSSVELTPLSTYSDQSPQPTTSQFPPQDDQPKVVVPNIEEELNYLAEDNIAYKPPRTSSSNPNSAYVRPNTVVNKKNDKISGPGVGFMNSYLKFLQGDKDSSPPPASRGNRKQSWTKTKTIVTPPPAPPAATTVPDIKPTDTNTNGIVTRPPPIAAPILTPRLSQGDPQDDPRYFPLPKERKKNSFDSSDDGVSSDDEFFHHKRAPPPPVKVENPPPVQPPKEKEKQKRKGRPPKVGEAATTTEKKKSKAERQNKQANSDGTKAKREPRAEPVPKRESSKRAAKERSNIKLIAKREEEADENDFVDSDSDPAWTPQCKDDPEPDVMMKKSKRGRPGRKRNLRNLLSTAAEGAGIHDISDNSNDITQIKKQKTSTKKENQNKSSDQPSETTMAHTLSQKNLPPMSEDNFFKTGEFVVIKSELSEEWPAIWRVDGKTLLQKYEPFEQSGQTLYRNISTYTSWTPESKKQYMSVPVKYRSQSHLETIVEFLRNEMTVVDHAFMDKVLKENEVYQDNFEVYIQTLISQALDSNFLTEIFQEQDDYFLSNVQTIDDITRSKKQKLLTLLKWPHPVQIAVSTWPCFNIIRELSTPDFQSRNCAACQQSGVSVRVLMYGQPYNSTTLEGCQPDPQAANEKDFLMCRICSNRVQLLNKISHQKYLMYIECAKRVADKRSTDAHKDTTCILNELLADEAWLNQLFLDVRNSWGEVDSLEHNYKQRNSKSQ